MENGNMYRMIANRPDKGKIRYKTFKAVFERYNRAMEAGFYLEAVTLMESILSDRLESQFRHEGIAYEGYPTVGRLIELMNDNKDSFCKEIIKLCPSIKRWNKARNRAIHCMAKISEKNMGRTVETKYKEAKECAEDGRKLVDSINRIIQQNQRKHKTMVKKSQNATN